MGNEIKIIGFFFILSVISSKSFGQQFLWVTGENETEDIKTIPISEVTDEVLKFYEQYEMYYDQSGYSKERFIKEIGYGFDDWNWLNDIKELTVFALKSNSGTGSIILVLCISKENVNLIIFSNNPVDGDFNFQMTSSYSSREKERFSNWFETLLN